jgi:hypothetical protein
MNYQMAFNLANYETVDERLEKFWAAYPDGRIATEIELITDDRCIIKTYIYKTFLDSVAFATGIAEERSSDRGVNSTSFVENCESSSIGRALHTGGISKHSDGKPRPSRIEMEKVERLTAKQIQQANEVPSFKTKEEALAADPWSNHPVYNDPNQPMAVSAAEAIATIQDVLGISNAEGCIHGDMVWKEGEKNGRAWGGFFCAYAPRTGEAKCSTVWYKLASTGKWERQALRSV